MAETFSIKYQTTVSRLLANALKSGRLHSAYLFCGNEGFGKWNAAVSFAAEILSSHWKDDTERKNAIAKTRKLIHPDLHLLFPMPSPKNKSEESELPQFFRQTKADDPFSPVEYGKVTNILIDSVRQFKSAIFRTPSEGGYRVGVFQQVERMPETSFDVLLKTIEEPPPLTVLILLTDNIRRLPATVVSRCQKVRFVPVAQEHIVRYLIDRKQLSTDEAERFARLSGGSFSEAYRLSQSDISERREVAISLLGIIATGSKSDGFVAVNEAIDMRNRDEIFATIKLWQGFMRDVLVLKHDLPDTHLMNADCKDDLLKIGACFSDHRAVSRSITEMLETQKLFYRNVPPRPALTRLAWQLNEIAHGNFDQC